MQFSIGIYKSSQAIDLYQVQTSREIIHRGSLFDTALQQRKASEASVEFWTVESLSKKSRILI